MKKSENIDTVNRITINKEDYPTQEDFENAIKKAVMVLLDNNYIMTIKYDEKGSGIVCIDYNFAEESHGYPYPHWLSLDEFNNISYEEIEK